MCMSTTKSYADNGLINVRQYLEVAPIIEIFLQNF
jgi:hypothetical protein